MKKNFNKKITLIAAFLALYQNASASSGVKNEPIQGQPSSKIAPADVAKAMKAAFSEPLLFKKKCSKEYGKIKWDKVKNLIDSGYKSQVFAFISKNMTGCNGTDDKNFMTNLENSCKMYPTLLKDKTFTVMQQQCKLAENEMGLKNTNDQLKAQSKEDDKTLFYTETIDPCSANVAKQFNPIGLSAYFSKQHAISVNPQYTPSQKAMGIAGMKKATDHISKIHQCVEKGHKNFTTVLSQTTFSNATKAEECATKYNASVFKGASAPMIAQFQNLCVRSKQQNAVNGIPQIKKTLNVPTTSLTYGVNGASMYKPFAEAGASHLIDTWAKLYAKGFIAHFTILDKRLANPSNINEINAMIHACKGELQNNQQAIVQKACTTAKQSTSSNFVSEYKKTLGIKNGYDACKVAKSIDATAITGLIKLSPSDATDYMNRVTNCVSDLSTAEAVNNACEAGLSNVEAAQGMCQAAKGTINTNNDQTNDPANAPVESTDASAAPAATALNAPAPAVESDPNASVEDANAPAPAAQNDPFSLLPGLDATYNPSTDGSVGAGDYVPME